MPSNNKKGRRKTLGDLSEQHSSLILRLRRTLSCGNDSIVMRKIIDGEGIYEGEILAGRRHGKGKLFSGRLVLFDGDWKDDKPSGYGIRMFPNGDIYQGNHTDGLRSGWGLFTWASGDKYIGNWSEGLMSGKGSLTSADGESFVGAWVKGTMHGKGRHTLIDGSSLEGDFVRGKLQGNIVKRYACGDLYEGDCVANKCHGYGVYTWVDGACYRGQWEEDQMTGQGERTSQSPETAAQYQRATTLGFTEVGDAVAAYSGSFRNGRRDGPGIAKFWDGRQYTGHWLDDIPHGWGCCRYPDGYVFEGHFDCGKRHGMGTMTRILPADRDDLRFDFFSTYDNDEPFLENSEMDSETEILRLASLVHLYDVLSTLLHSPVGTSLSCEWRDNIPHGPGFVSFREKTLYEGEFSEGFPITF